MMQQNPLISIGTVIDNVGIVTAIKSDHIELDTGEVISFATINGMINDIKFVH